MSTTTLGPHLNFLSDAAHILAETAPETSAFIMGSRTGLMFANELQPSDVQKQHVCGACGYIMIPGQSSTLKIESGRALRRGHGRGSGNERNPASGKDRGSRSGPTKVFTCDHCHRETKITLPAPGPVSRRKSSARISVVPSATSQGTEVQKPTANASSKKRAKSRKAGLQALIEQNQVNRSSAKSGLGLSLADFMKK